MGCDHICYFKILVKRQLVSGLKEQELVAQELRQKMCNGEVFNLCSGYILSLSSFRFF